MYSARHCGIVAVTVALYCAAPVWAQTSFSGTYTGKSEDATYTLKLQQEADGTVTGTLTEDQSVTQLKGTVSGDGKRITGKVVLEGQEIPVEFEIRREGERLRFAMKVLGEEDVTFFTRTGKADAGTEPTKAEPGEPGEPAETRAAPVSGATFAGTFKGAEMTLSLTEQGGKYTGTILQGGKKYPVKATRVPQGIEGTFEAEGESYEFRAKLEGNSLLLNTDGTTHVLLRAGEAKSGKANPLAKPANASKNPLAKPPVKTVTKAAPPVAPATGKAYRHPSGIRMNLPDGWKIVQAGTSPVLLPPGASKPDGDELYMFLIGDASGIESKDDPRLAQFIEGLLNGESGLFGGKIAFEKANSSSGLAYTATTAQGQTAYARCFFSNPKGVVAAILAVGVKNRIQPREKALQSAAASITVGAMENDPRLIGNWSGKVIPGGIDARDSAGRLQASSATDSSTTYRIAADGTFVEEKHSRTIAIGQGVSVDTGDQVERTQGRWCAGNGVFAIIGESGLYTTGTYRFEGGQLVLRLGGRTVALGQ